MYVGEHRWEEFFYYLHALSDAKLTGVFSLRVVDGRLTSSTMKDIKAMLYRNGIRAHELVAVFENRGGPNGS